MVFIKSYLYLGNKEMFCKFEDATEAITRKQKDMGIVEMVNQILKEEGIEIGMKKGQKKAKASIVYNLLLKTNHSIQEIAEFAEVSVDFVIKIKNNLPSASN